MTDNNALYADAMLGKDAEEFVLSPVGSYIISRAEEEAAEAMTMLKSCKPTDSEEIAQLQNRIWRAESIQSWIGELVIQGRQALSQLETQED